MAGYITTKRHGKITNKNETTVFSKFRTTRLREKVYEFITKVHKFHLGDTHNMKIGTPERKSDYTEA